MCYSVYLGTNQTLEPIPWNESQPAFYFEEVSGDDERVKIQFSKSQVYFIGSHEGCSCGFAYDAGEVLEDQAIREQNVKSFQELLNKILNIDNDCEVFLCWQGGQVLRPARIATMSPDFFSGGQWVTVKDKPAFFKVKRNDHR